MTIIKKNTAYSEHWGKTFLGKKAHLTSSKEVAISFSKIPKEASKSSIKKINFVSMDNESVEVPKSSTDSVFSVVT